MEIAGARPAIRSAVILADLIGGRTPAIPLDGMEAG